MVDNPTGKDEYGAETELTLETEENKHIHGKNSISWDNQRGAIR